MVRKQTSSKQLFRGYHHDITEIDGDTRKKAETDSLCLVTAKKLWTREISYSVAAILNVFLNMCN